MKQQVISVAASWLFHLPPRDNLRVLSQSQIRCVHSRPPSASRLHQTVCAWQHENRWLSGELLPSPRQLKRVSQCHQRPLLNPSRALEGRAACLPHGAAPRRLPPNAPRYGQNEGWHRSLRERKPRQPRKGEPPPGRKREKMEAVPQTARKTKRVKSRQGKQVNKLPGLKTTVISNQQTAC